MVIIMVIMLLQLSMAYLLSIIYYYNMAHLQRLVTRWISDVRVSSDPKLVACHGLSVLGSM
jgi:hypothetical protein